MTNPSGNMQNIPERYAALLAVAARRLDAVAAEVAADITLPGEDAAAVAAQVRPTIAWFVDRLAAASDFGPAALSELRAEGAAAAGAGEPLHRLLDRYLSTGWALWAAVQPEADSHRAAPEASAAALAALGRALLRAIDRAAAAIGEGYSAAERDLVARTASARREYLDELLELPPDDPVAAGRVRRRAPQFGLDPGAEYQVLVADLGRELEDGGPELDRTLRAIGRSPRPERDRARGSDPIATTRRGRLVVLAPSRGATRLDLDPLLSELAGGVPWRAAVSRDVTGIAEVAGAHREALETLAVAQRAGRAGRLNAADLLLERALLSDVPLAEQAVARELGSLLAAPRNGEVLLATLGAWLAAGQSISATARNLGVAPRTVAYRLARIAALLGRPLRGATVLRITVALELRRLLAGETAPARVMRTAARRRSAPCDRSQSRRGHAAASGPG
ncbi:MAG: hypothetical protein FJ038_09380 [Chloroflexi bacterium]|nr:hypothetical protein [Chloroflexota bacterium]